MPLVKSLNRTSFSSVLQANAQAKNNARTISNVCRGTLQRMVCSPVDSQSVSGPVFQPHRNHRIYTSFGPDKSTTPERELPSVAEITERILKAIQTFDRLPKDKEVTMDTNFANDLGLDSLDHVELIVAIEKEFTIEVDEDAAESLVTPKEMLKYICTKLDTKESELGLI